MAAVAPNNEAITKAPTSISPCRRRSLATVCRGTTGCAERIVRSSLKCGSPEVRSSRQLFSVLDISCMFAHRRGVSSACLIAITRPLRHMTVFTVLSTLAGVSVRGVERFGASKRRARLSIIRKNRTGELGAGAATSSKRNHRSRIALLLVRTAPALSVTISRVEAASAVHREHPCSL